MASVILDTNFIITCVKQKIDFFEEIKLMGLNILISEQVIEELEKIGYEENLHEARTALKILESHDYELLALERGSADRGIINYAKSHKEVIVATLDRDLKISVPNQKLVIMGKKKLEIV
jgi:rRNA-processing protein FCF1